MIRFVWEKQDPVVHEVAHASADSAQKDLLEDAGQLPDGPGDIAQDRAEDLVRELDWANDYASHPDASSAENLWNVSNDAPLLGLNLHHEEGKPATLTITVPRGYISTTERYRGRRGMVLYQKNDSGQNTGKKKGKKRGRKKNLFTAEKPPKRLFYGHVVEVVEKENTTELLLVSDLFPLQAQWENMAKQIKSMGAHHALWDNDDPENLLAGVPYTRYWDRCTGKISLSHAVKGAATWDVSHLYDPKYRVTHKKEPVSQIKMEISAHWDQKMMRYTDIAPEIARCFPKGVMGTLTDRALESSWPEMGRTFAGGYFVSESSLRKIQDARYPLGIVFRGAAQAGGMQEGEPEQAHWIAECSFYEGRLVVGYAYRQKRKEIVTYTLQAALADSETGRSATIALNVPDFVQYDDVPQWHPMGFYQENDIVQHEGRIYQYRQDLSDPMNMGEKVGVGLQRAYDGAEKSPAYWEELPEKTKWLLPIVSPSFFTATLGKEIFTHSLERAKTALIWGTRCIEDKIRGTIDDLHAITLDDAIVLPARDAEFSDPLGQKITGKVTGKVAAYTLHMDVMKNTGYVEITGAFSVACQEKPAQDMPEHIVNDTTGHTIDTIQGITYAWPQKAPPPDKVSENLGQGICKHIVVKNHIHDQLTCIKKVQERMLLDQWDPEQVQSKETRITLQFHSLNTKECLEHPIAVQILNPFFYAS